jgi:phosphatidylethanolamine/phosphatidyl-N-methylethanolamine N-methyltransferase
MAAEPGRGYWERHAGNYDRSMRILGGPLPRMLELTVRAARGRERVLEVAAGTGLVTAAVAPAVGRLVATDYAEAMVASVQRRVDALGLTNVRCERADVYALGYEDGAFDAVIAANVLHLVPDLAGALAALRRVLAPGGKLIAPTFCHDETFGSRVLAITGFPGARRFRAQSLEDALRGAGFHVGGAERIPGVIPIAFVEAHAAN